MTERIDLLAHFIWSCRVPPVQGGNSLPTINGVYGKWAAASTIGSTMEGKSDLRPMEQVQDSEELQGDYFKLGPSPPIARPMGTKRFV